MEKISHLLRFRHLKVAVWKIQIQQEQLCPSLSD